MFPKIAEYIFQQWNAFNIPFFSYIFKLAISYFANGLYLAQNIKSILKEVYSIDKSILNCLYAISIETMLGFPIAIVSNYLLYWIFTNYNRVGTRDKE